MKKLQPDAPNSIWPTAAPMADYAAERATQAVARSWMANERLPMREPGIVVTRVTVPVQGSDREYYAQLVGVQLAAGLNLPLRAIHVRSATDAGPADCFEFLQRQALRWRIQLEAKTLESSDVAGELVRELTPQDLVVIGTRRLGTQFHVGSVAERLVRNAPCPVQIVRLE